MAAEDVDRGELFKKNNAYVPPGEGGGSGMAPPGEQAIYTAEEQQMLQKAKQQNKETTRLAREALKTVQQTEEVATGTLEELGRQDAQLDKIQTDYEQIESDLKESKQAVSYMDRCCLLFCCACCCECDRHSKEDASRKKRVAARSELAAEEKKFAELTAQDKAQTTIRTAKSGGVQSGEQAEAENRDQLMGAKSRLQDGANGNGASTSASAQIGAGLEDGDRSEIQAEVQQQDDALDLISDHLDNIKNMAEAMGGTLREQDTKIDAISGRTEMADEAMKDLQKRMKKI